MLTSQTRMHGRAEACDDSWGRELTSPGLASELVTWTLRDHILSLGRGGSGCLFYTEGYVLGSGVRGGGGRSQLLVRPNLILLMTLKVDRIFISV